MKDGVCHPRPGLIQSMCPLDSGNKRSCPLPIEHARDRKRDTGVVDKFGIGAGKRSGRTNVGGLVVPDSHLENKFGGGFELSYGCQPLSTSLVTARPNF